MSDNLISRQAVLSLPRNKTRNLFGQVIEETVSIKDIESLPTIEPRRGRWTLKENVFGVAYCSECDYELHTNNTNFCPDCGADMREVSE